MPLKKQEREPKSDTIARQQRQEQEPEEAGVRKVLLRQTEVDNVVLQRHEGGDSEVLQEVSQNLQMPPRKQPGPRTKTMHQGAHQGAQLRQDQEDRMALQRQREADRERERSQRQHDAVQRNIKRKELAKALRWQHGI